MWLCWILGWGLLTGGITGPDSQYFLPSQIGFIIVQTLMFVGFLGVWWSHGVGRGIFDKIAFGLGWLGHFLFVAAEIFSLATGSEDLLAVAALSTVVGLILTGIAVLRTQRWRGWGRWTPLLAGIYPLIGMFPFLIIYGEPSYLSVGLWGFFRLLLGLAIREQANSPVENESEGANATLRTRSI